MVIMVRRAKLIKLDSPDAQANVVTSLVGSSCHGTTPPWCVFLRRKRPRACVRICQPGPALQKKRWVSCTSQQQTDAKNNAPPDEEALAGAISDLYQCGDVNPDRRYVYGSCSTDHCDAGTVVIAAGIGRCPVAQAPRRQCYHWWWRWRRHGRGHYLHHIVN